MRKIIFALSITVLTLAACKKTEELQGPNRLFRPVLKEDLKSDGNWIEASWEPIKGATSYTVQLSKDSFRTVVASATVDTSYYVFDNLKWEQLYQVQVRANAQDTAQNSKFSDLGSIKTPRFPSILNVPGISDVSDNAVRVSWTNSGATVTEVKILKASDSSVVKDVTLSSTDVTNGYRIVSGLKALTDYIVFLYSGSSVRGWANFTTTAAIAGNIIDLRDITGIPSILADTLPDIPSGSIVLLKRGESYTVNGANLDKSVTILSGTDLMVPDQAIINLTSNFDIATGSTIDSLVFKDVKLLPNDYANKYVFNISQDCNIGKLKFEACRAEIMRGLVRIKGGTVTIDNFEINNCIIDSVAGYGIINVDVTSAKVNNILIQNSTIYKAEKFITSKNNSNSVLVENCTLNEVPYGGNFLIDYSAKINNVTTTFDVTSPIGIKNIIIGIGKDKAGNRTGKVYQVGPNTSFDVSGTYATSDRLISGTDLPSIISYTKPSTELWKDPANGDFTIIDSGFPGKSSAGDPRWQP
jgi:hypothetical protein